MSNTSATGGTLSVTATSPQGTALQRFIQQWLASVTGLNGDLVRPRWQQNPPPVPAIATDWLAFGITGIQEDANAVVQTAGVNGTLTRHQTLTYLLSFYGASALAKAVAFRDAVNLSQNVETLLLNNLGLVSCENIVHTADLINDQWCDRYDLTLVIAQRVTYTTAVLSQQSAPATISIDVHPNA